MEDGYEWNIFVFLQVSRFLMGFVWTAAKKNQDESVGNGKNCVGKKALSRLRSKANVRKKENVQLLKELFSSAVKPYKIYNSL
jgi:hypothetical protein